MLTDLSHLVEKDALPEFTPQRKILFDEIPVIGGNGIDLKQTEDGIVVSLDEETVRSIEQASQSEAVDPFAEMGFRVSTSDSSVTIKRGYIAHVYWDGNKWLMEELEIPEGVITDVAYPVYVYAEIPIEYIENTLDTDDGSTPFESLSSAVTIEGNPYTVTTSISTAYKRVKVSSLLALGDASIFVVSASQLYSDDTKFRCLLAFIQNDGTVLQAHMGQITVPQAFNQVVNDFTIA